MIGWIVGGTAAASLGVSLRWNWWRWPQVGIPVLMYHHIGRCPPEFSSLRKLWVSPAQFARQLEYLQHHGYHPSSLTEFAEHLRPAATPPANGRGTPILLTFDDGYASIYTAAFPLLQQRQAKATVFLVAEGIDHGNFWRDPRCEPDESLLTWARIREMQGAGIDFGCHGLTHRNLLHCTPAELQHEVADSKRLLEDRLGTAVTAFAYPFGAGAFDPRVRAAVAQAGYHLAFSIRQGKARLTQDPLALHRVLIRGDDTAWDFALNVDRGKARF